MPPFADLTEGVLQRIMLGDEVEKPVLQILGVKKIAGSETDRFRILISDGKYFNSFAMLATQLNHLHGEGKLQEFSIVRLDNYITSLVNKSDSNKRVLIVLDMEILNPGEEVGRKIGSPVSYTDAKPAEAAATKPIEPTGNAAVANSSSSNNVNGSSGSSSKKAAPKDVTLNTSITHPIAGLSPYQNNWVIKARVTAKTPVRTWSNAKGEGKLFSMDLMDESGEIRATAFKEQCDKYFDTIQVDNVYYIARCQLKPANKQYSSLKNDYEMTFTSETVVQECMEDDSGIPDIKYDLVPISQVANMEPKSVLDILGVVKEYSEVQEFTSRNTNKEFKKRELVVVDTSNAAVSLTLWGEDAANFQNHVHPVILLKGARLTEFNGGKSLSMGQGTVMKINPDIPAAHKLRSWFDQGGEKLVTNFISARTTAAADTYSTEWVTFYEAKQKGLGTGDKPDYFQLRGVVHNVKTQNAFYKACIVADCNKKVIDAGENLYRCERHNTNSPNFKYRLLLNMIIGDWTSNRWVTCFSDVAERLLQHSAEEVGLAFEGEDENKGKEILDSINFHSYVFKLRTKVEMYGDAVRNKITVVDFLPMRYAEYNRYLIKNIEDLSGVAVTTKN